MKRVRIVCDGSSLGNGQTEARAGAAAILTYRDAEGEVHHRAVGEYLGTATNNQAEIVASCIGLEALKRPCHVLIITDSRYVVETMMGRFRRKLNHAYWQRLDRAAARHTIDWRWTKGHAGHEIQERCDRAARGIAAAGRVLPELLLDAIDAVDDSEAWT